MSATIKFRSSKRKRLILRENTWNARFHLSSIPKYDPVMDIHCERQTGQNYLSSIAKRKVVYLRPGTLSRSRSKRRKYKEALPLSTELLSLPRSAHLEDLAKYWTVKAVPLEQQSAFLAVIEGLAEERKKVAIAEELELVKKDKSFSQLVDRLIFSREQAIEKLDELLAAIGQDALSVSRGQFEQLSETLSLIRDLSLETVQTVQSWRQHLYALNPSNQRILKLPYIWEGGNYLLKLRGDLAYLKDSIASRFFEFSKRNDPFLQFPTHAFKQQKSGQKKIMDLPLAPETAHDIKICEKILLEEVLNGKEIDRTFRRESVSDRRESEGRQGLSSSNEGGRSDERMPVQPASEELVRPVTRGKEKQFGRVRAMQRTAEACRDESV